ncbi:hypothetical protein [Fischerella sp. PCC 9605]|uniref:hypothetical protein n=1 Tax=Fischerella sp. PCC 9605 TaxID=1173024 RepID=UPI0004BBA51B|nr:hypothetical protein [Fischerella sp. PCC 9605]
MKLDKIISLANNKVRLRFLAMERSLRATGCQLPLLVIPYDDNLFKLPKGSTWWEIPEIISWLKAEQAHPMMRKYQCLTVSDYQYVDSDICFLRNPEEVLEPYSGFIASCCHWHNPEGTYTKESQKFISSKSTIWQSKVFNAGQFACDRPLFTIDSLKAIAMQPDFVETCVHFPFHDQPGLNLLLWQSGVEIVNLTLPPINMESTWAGDYLGNPEHYWTDPLRKPYLIHWAGTRMDVPRPIHQIFYNFLTQAEKAEWDEQVKQWSLSYQKKSRSVRTIARRFKHAFQALLQP